VSVWDAAKPDFDKKYNDNASTAKIVDKTVWSGRNQCELLPDQAMIRKGLEYHDGVVADEGMMLIFGAKPVIPKQLKYEKGEIELEE